MLRLQIEGVKWVETWFGRLFPFIGWERRGATQGVRHMASSFCDPRNWIRKFDSKYCMSCGRNSRRSRVDLIVLAGAASRRCATVRHFECGCEIAFAVTRAENLVVQLNIDW